MWAPSAPVAPVSSCVRERRLTVVPSSFAYDDILSVFTVYRAVDLECILLFLGKVTVLLDKVQHKLELVFALFV